MITAVTKYKDGRVITYNEEIVYSDTKFKNGYYTAYTTNEGAVIITEDKLTELHNPFSTEENKKVIAITEGFFNKGAQDIVNKLGFLHKIGILLHGSAGCGKTSLIHFLANSLIEKRKAIVFFINDDNSFSTIVNLAKDIRKIQDNPIVFIADEFEQYIKSRANESNIKQFLDGKDSIENTLFLAATNYIDDIPETIAKRPSRFRFSIEIKGIEKESEVVEIIKSITKKTKIKPALVFKRLELPATIDTIKAAILDEALSINFPINEIIHKPLGFGSKHKDQDKELSNIVQLKTIDLSSMFGNKRQ